MLAYKPLLGIAGLGWTEMLIIFAILLLLFGGAKLPQLGSSLGSAIRNFKKGFNDEEKNDPNAKSMASGGTNTPAPADDKAKQS